MAVKKNTGVSTKEKILLLGKNEFAALPEAISKVDGENIFLEESSRVIGHRDLDRFRKKPLKLVGIRRWRTDTYVAFSVLGNNGGPEMAVKINLLQRGDEIMKLLGS